MQPSGGQLLTCDELTACSVRADHACRQAMKERKHPQEAGVGEDRQLASAF